MKRILVLMMFMLACGYACAGPIEKALDLRKAGKIPEAIAALSAIVADPNATPAERAGAQYAKAQTIGGFQKDYKTGIAEMEKVISMPGSSSIAAWAMYHIGVYHEAQGDTAKAQQSYVRACELPGVVSAYKAALKRIDRLALGEAAYKKLLATLVLAVPAVPENAEFLGFLKSEQEKMK